MKRSEAAKYARWSAATALLLACLTAGVYLERRWAGRQERQKAPPPAPKEVTRQSNGITFSKVEGNQKIFTVEAKKATDFKDQTASLMEDVKITIFGKTGERHDTIHTQSCEYAKDGDKIVCSGDVRIDLESAADAERAEKNPKEPQAQMVRVETRGVTFHRGNGIAQSDQQVNFVFPNGRGKAIGVDYHSEEGAIRLLRDVSFTLTPPADTKAKPAPNAIPRQPVHVTGKSADFGRDSRVLQLHGPVEAQSGAARMSAGELTLTLDKAFRAEKLVATSGANGKNPAVELQGAGGKSTFSGETLTAYFVPEGWVTRIEGAGAVQGSRANEKETDEFNAESATLELHGKARELKNLNLKGNAALKTKGKNAGESRTLQTDALVVEFAEGQRPGRSQPQRAQTLARGTLAWIDPVAPNGAPAAITATSAGSTKLTGDKLELEFGTDGKARLLTATGNVETERSLPGKPMQTATAQSGVAQLLDTGGWSQMELQGDVKLKEGDRSGQAEHATFVRSAQTATLTGKAVARDTTTETHAPRITFVQNTGDIRAEGGVRSTDFPGKGSGVQLAPVPTNISANTLQVNSKTGRALYSGNARLWQGDSVMEADSIELLRETKVLNAVGNVKAVFPQAARQTPPHDLSVQPPAPKKPQLWHVTAGTLSYMDSENRAHLEKNVVAKSAEQTIRAPVADLYFTRSEKSNAPAANASGNAPSGSQQITRAVGTGGVIVDQGTRRATAERGEYTAADGKFVMSGGNPTIFDAAEGTITGRQLTFFLAGDTIIVDSENGSRTLTKHRVEK
ncbi:MAG TPA: LPS export ABC transporter periplasmic protein LptC [Candidatus Angelobacter sp.]|nr:LPS export ABC transporter periplasmic protein LptC [Candidatus Angelobacter sp.]